MKIVIDGRMILAEMSGVGRYLVSLCSELKAGQDGNVYELWLQDGLPRTHPVWALQGGRLSLRTLPLRQMSLAGQARIPLELRRAQPDLLHYPHFDLPFAAPGPLVATIHDLKYIARPDFFPKMGWSKRWLIRQMTLNTCRRAKRVICDSQAAADDLQNRLGVPAQKLRVVPLGVEQRFFQRIGAAELNAYRQKMGLERPYLLFVGERRPHKNLPGLLAAFKLFRQESGCNYALVIAGKRYSDYNRPEQMVAEMNLQDQVRFLEYVPDDELPYLYQGAQALALVSFYEGFGLPILEAMASGLAVVAADCASLPEVTGPAGLLVAADDPQGIARALRQAAQPGAEQDRLIAAGLERARSFSWEACARQTAQIYEEAMTTP